MSASGGKAEVLQTSLIRRKGTLGPKVSALIEVLLAHTDMGKKRRAARGNGRGVRSLG